MHDATSVMTSAITEDLRTKIKTLQKTKNFKLLGQMGGITVVKGHCGWGWRGVDDVCTSDDLPFEGEAWEAGCFESGLMMDVDDMEVALPEPMQKLLGFNI